MARTNTIGAEELTTLTARVLSAYYGLLAEGETTEGIGGHEIVQWIRRRLPEAGEPSASTVVKTLAAAGLTHRGRGQPTVASRAVHAAPPLCPVRPTAPSPRSRGR